MTGEKKMTTYRLASGEQVAGEFSFVLDRDFFDDLDEAETVVEEVWVLQSTAVLRLGPLDLCEACSGDGTDEEGEECQVCAGSGEEVRP